MRIALGAEALSPQLTGIGRYTWELANRLPSVADGCDLKLFRDNSWHRNGEHFLRHSHPPKSFLPRKIREWTSKKEFQQRLFHGPNFFFPHQAENAIITVHDLSVFRFPETHPVERIKQFEKEFQRSIDKARHIITDTNYIKNELTEMFGVDSERISAIPLGVSSEFFESGTPENDDAILGAYSLTGKRYCLCVATIEPRKGLSHAVNAFLQYREKEKSEAVLVIAGASGWNNSELHDLFEKHSRSGALHFLGFVPDADLRAIYRRCSLFLYPSLYEGFGLPVLEAMASKVPVLTSDRSCLPEVSGGVAMSVDVENHDKFQDAIHKALDDKSWRSEAISNGLKLASDLNWDRCAQKTAEIYRNFKT